MHQKSESALRYAWRKYPLKLGRILTILIIALVVGGLGSVIVDPDTRNIAILAVMLASVLLIYLTCWLFLYLTSCQQWLVYGEAAQRLKMDIDDLYDLCWDQLPATQGRQLRSRLSSITQDDVREIKETYLSFRELKGQLNLAYERELSRIIARSSAEVQRQPVH